MNPKTIQFQYDINRMDAVNLVATIHIDDYNTRFLEVLLYERGGAFDVSGSTATARFVTLAGELLNDSVPCTVEGNAVTVPIDAAAVKSQACTLKIEINLTKGGKVLTLPFPLWIRVRGSILDDAHITPESEGTIAELLKAAQEALDAAAAALEGAGDYSKLDNKPQINGHTLSGNKTSSELGLQGKLTVGDNVTIDENGVISAEGGTDDYNDLTNKPSVNISLQVRTLAGTLVFSHDDFKNPYASGSSSYGVKLTDRVFRTALNTSYAHGYDFNYIENERAGTGCWYEYKNDVVNLPTQFQDATEKINIFHFTNPDAPGLVDNIRVVTYLNTSNKIRTFIQFFKLTAPLPAVQNKRQVYDTTIWQEIGGGSEIASAAVNQNGTISFYDADGNPLFTTSDEKIVTSGNQQISMGYDNGGFYFLFDDGQEVVNNGSN